MEKKVSFDKNLMIALEKAEEIIIKEFFAHYGANKYKKKFKISVGEGKFLRMVVIIKETEEYPYQYNLEFADFYGRPTKTVFKTKEFNLKRIREKYCEHYSFAFDYQKLESRP